jgi:hypothetical protein
MGPVSSKARTAIPTYPAAKYDHILSSIDQGHISEDEEEHGQRKVAEGLGKIKDSYNDIKSVYA